MPKANDQRIIEQLTSANELEMQRHELEALLENELQKPAEEIDARLVGELLEVLQPEEMPNDVQQKLWRNIQRQNASKLRKTTSILRRLTAVAAIVILLFGLTFGTARAFRWTFLLKLLQPVAETFGIYMNYSDDTVSDTVPEQRYGVSEDENTTAIHYDLSALPDAYDGYAIKPGWIPEGYVFAYATSFAESNLIKYSICYQRGSDELSVQVSAYPDPGEVTSNSYELTMEEVFEKNIDSKMVTFYRNAHDSIQSVSWVEGNLHYSISGKITIDEIDRMVSGYLNDETE